MKSVTLKSTARNTAFVFVLGSVAYFLSYAIRIMLAKNLDVENYGLFFSIFSLILLLTVFRDMGLNTATVKFTADALARRDFSRIKTLVSSFLFFQFIFSAVIIGIFWVLAPFLAAKFFRTQEALLPFRVVLFYFLATPLLISTKSLLQGLQDIKSFAFADLFKNGCTLLLLMIFFHFGFHLFAPVYAYTFGSLLAFGLLLAPLYKHRKILHYKISNFTKATKNLFKFGIPVTFVGFGEMVISYSDVIILTYFTSLNAVGIYSAVLPTAMLFLFFGRAVSGVLFPAVANLWGGKETEKIKIGVTLIYKYMFLGLVPIIFFFLAYAPEIINLFFGKNYLGGVLPFRILLLGVVFYTVAQLNNYIISAIGKPKTTAKIIFIIALLNLLLNFGLIPLYGITGAAIATATSYFSALILTVLAVNVFLSVKAPVLDWVKIFFAGVVFLSVLIISKILLNYNFWIKTTLSFALALTAYVVFVLVTNAIDPKEIKVIIWQVLKNEN